MFRLTSGSTLRALALKMPKPEITLPGAGTSSLQKCRPPRSRKRSGWLASGGKNEASGWRGKTAERAADFRPKAIVVGMLAASSAATAHSGGLNAAGCHNDRKNGGYHCHRAPVREALPFRQSSTDSAYYPNCAAARAAGAAPMRVGDPGYRAGLDRDGDGVACE